MWNWGSGDADVQWEAGVGGAARNSIAHERMRHLTYQIRQKEHASLTKNTYNIESTQKATTRFSCLLRHPAWKRSRSILVECEGMWKQKIDESNKKGKRKKFKKTKNRVESWEVKERREGELSPAHTGHFDAKIGCHGNVQRLTIGKRPGL